MQLNRHSQKVHFNIEIKRLTYLAKFLLHMYYGKLKYYTGLIANLLILECTLCNLQIQSMQLYSSILID